MSLLEVQDLFVEVNGKQIIKGLSLTLEEGKVHALMGPNGSGKSTLSYALMGHPKYTITSGKIIFKGEDITNLSADERAKKGLFLSFQYPQEIPGVTLSNFLRTALNSLRDEKISLLEFKKLLAEKMDQLKIDKKFVQRYLNEGFSGGEKKKAEILQLLMLGRTLAILDETDSGLDIDALKIVSEGIGSFMGPDKCILLITHYKRMIDFVPVDKVFIIKRGRIVTEGGPELVDRLEEQGYSWLE
ncbi:Fe-S cluster assembly ATPase SufC [Candidatus Woesearchaeota archaeon]|nr:Fe-S cluster assembly ATPase SufC [Candidatus Woesearchaeota archaeon]